MNVEVNQPCTSTHLIPVLFCYIYVYMQGYYNITVHIVVVDIWLHLSLYEVYMHIQIEKHVPMSKKKKGSNIYFRVKQYLQQSPDKHELVVQGIVQLHFALLLWQLCLLLVD